MPDFDEGTPYSKDVLVYSYNNIFVSYICWDDCIFDDDGNLDIKCGLVNAMKNGWGFWDSATYCDALSPSHWMPIPEKPSNLG